MNDQGLLTKTSTLSSSAHRNFKDGFSQENCYFHDLDDADEVKEHLYGLSMNNNHPNFFIYMGLFI